MMERRGIVHANYKTEFSSLQFKNVIAIYFNVTEIEF